MKSWCSEEGIVFGIVLGSPRPWTFLPCWPWRCRGVFWLSQVPLKQDLWILDSYQRKVVERGISFARELKKSSRSKNPSPNPPKLILLGGAGSGKSATINILKQWIHIILKTEGDNPDCPYLLVAAPTGTAAANVKGQTLHSSFGFSFGNKHFSLSDKNRALKRAQMKNLKAIIIDELSMIKSDTLY